MICCNKPMTVAKYQHPDLEEKSSYLHCSKCGSHYFDGQFYTADAWFFYINGVSYQQYQDQLLLEECPHAHELINHSQPESF